MLRRTIGTGLIAAGVLTACTERIQGEGPADGGDVSARFDVGDASFWATPFPGDHRVREDSRRPDVAAFPNPDEVPLVGALVDLLDDGSQGWSVSGAVYLPLSGPVRTGNLPSRAESTSEDALVFLMDVDEASPGLGTRAPADIVYRGSASPYGPAHALAALPVQGLPLRARTRYAMVALRPLAGTDGIGVETPPAVAALVRGETPEGWRDDVGEQYLDALRVLAVQGVDTGAIAGLTVFTTAQPTSDFLDHAAWVRDHCITLQDKNQVCPLRWVGPPQGQTSQFGFVVDEMTDDYCVFEGRMLARSYQQGVPPYATGEGGWVVDSTGTLVEQKEEYGRFWITVPRSATAGDALPAVVFVRTGGGGDRPLLDRGIRTEAGTDAGTLQGYAAEFAQAGWIGIMVDGPLGGERNPDGGDEQFAIFDIDNPIALRDNLRQSALELVALPSVLEGLRLAPEICPLDGLEPGQINPQDVRIDVDRLAIFGHSMGATIAPLVVAAQPAYKHVILSGAGGSWIDNVVYKEKPIATAPVAAAMLQEADAADVDRHHPALTLLQWAGEPAEPFLYAPRYTKSALRTRRRDVLMIQGIVDRYIMPPMANAMTIAMGLDVAGPTYDAEDLPDLPSVDSVLGYSGASALDLPAWGNEEDDGKDLTAVVVQHREDGVEGGHEVAYQKPIARWQVRCFLQTLVEEGVGVVGRSGQADDPCDLPVEAEAP